MISASEKPSHRNQSVATVAPGRIAAIMGVDSATVQALFTAMVTDWRASGVRVGGVIAEPTGPPGRTCTAGVLRNIISGRVFPIYLETAPGGTSCHLDASGVQAACAEVLGQLMRCDVLVLSKFGKLEVARSGLIVAFQAAIDAAMPVLTSVSDKHREAWRAFVPAAIALPAEAAALQRWWLDQSVRAGSSCEQAPPAPRNRIG